MEKKKPIKQAVIKPLTAKEVNLKFSLANLPLGKYLFVVSAFKGEKNLATVSNTMIIEESPF